MIINTALFAFPVNLIIGLSLVFVAWRFKSLSSDRHMTIALLLMIAAALVQGFMPAQESFTRSWPFVIVLTWFLTVLASRLFRRFSLAGFGLWLALWAGMLGSADASLTRVLVHREDFFFFFLPFGSGYRDGFLQFCKGSGNMDNPYPARFSVLPYASRR